MVTEPSLILCLGPLGPSGVITTSTPLLIDFIADKNTFKAPFDELPLIEPIPKCNDIRS